MESCVIEQTTTEAKRRDMDEVIESVQHDYPRQVSVASERAMAGGEDDGDEDDVEEEMQTISIEDTQTCPDSHVTEEEEADVEQSNSDSPSSSRGGVIEHNTDAEDQKETHYNTCASTTKEECDGALSFQAAPASRDENPPCLKIKVVLVGDTGVGKSCILYKILGLNTNDCGGSTIGVDLRSKELVVDEQTITLQLYDTAGQSRFRSITRAYYRGADAVILVYDITNLESFSNAKDWAQELLSNSKSKCNILLGNKCDLEEQRVVSSQQGQQLADKFGFMFMEANIMDSTYIDEKITTIAREVKSKIAPTQPQCLVKRDYISIKVAPSPVLRTKSASADDIAKLAKANNNKGCLFPLYAWCGYSLDA